MGYLNKKTIYKSAIIALLIIFTMILRLPAFAEKPIFHYFNRSLIYALIYFAILIAWGISVKRRIIQRQTLKFLMAIVALMLFWFMVRTIRFIYTEDDSVMERCCWYAYYIPMLLIPLMSIFVALSLGKPENFRLPKWIGLIYIPTIIFIAFVLTNDFHQMVFVFPGGNPLSGSDYSYGPLYWLVWIWMIMSLLISLIITLAKSRVPHSKKILYLPFIPYFAGLIYGILYVGKVPFLRVIAGDMTAIFCLFTMAIFESLIQSGLIRSNIYYEEFFHASDLKAQILNKDYQICYQTNLAHPLFNEPLAKFVLGETNENMRMSAYPISGGQILWLEDISEMNGLIKELEEVNQRLSEENDLLQAELELKERKIKIDEKIRLQDKITEKIKPQLEQLNHILSGDIVESSLQEKLAQICVLGTYIKRRSNLLILSEDNNLFSAEELNYCLKESVEAMLQGEIDCSLKVSCKGKVKAKNAILIYDLFEEIIEAILPCIPAVFINLNISKGNIKMKLQINCNKGNNLADITEMMNFENTDSLVKNGGSMTKTIEDDTLAIAVELPRMGEKYD